MIETAINHAEKREPTNKERYKEMTRKEITKAIENYFTEHKDIFNEAIEELDSYNGYLGDDRYYEMSEIDEIYHDSDPSEILARAFYGYDADSYTTDSRGDRTYGAFNPNREYFKFNGYGNLVSSDYKDYSDKLDEWVINEMSENRAHIYTIEENDELAELFDKLEECEQ